MKRNRLMAFALALMMALSLCACWADTGLQSTDPTATTRPAITDPNALHYGLYIQNGQLFYANFVDETSILQIGNETITGDLIWWTHVGYEVDVYLSRDGRYMLYRQGYQSDEGASMYYIDLTAPEQPPIHIEHGYNIKYANEEFNDFIYVSGNLYRHDLTTLTTLATDLDTYYGFQISEDGNDILYVTEQDRSLYLIKDSGEPELITTGVTWCDASEDFNTVFYIRDNILYVKKQGQEEQKIASCVKSWSLYVNKDGTAYCFAEDQEKINILDILEGETKADKEKYSDTFIDSPYFSLYYFDGNQTHLVCDSALQRYPQDKAESTAALTYIATESAEPPGYAMSSFNAEFLYDAAYTVECYIKDYIEANTSFYLAVQENAVRMVENKQDGYLGSISDDGKYLYQCVYTDESMRSVDRYRLTMQGTQIVEKELVAEDMDRDSFLVTAGDSVIYLRDMQSNILEWSDKFGNYFSASYGSLYIDDQHIDDNVRYYYYGVKVDEQNRNGLIYYLKDWDPDTLLGTLKVYDGEKAETIMDNVYEMVLTPGGELMFLRNYDYLNCVGELWVYRNGTCEKLADNVNQIVTAQELP